MSHTPEPNINTEELPAQVEQKKSIITITDLFGLGKFIEKLNLQKLPNRMTYCLVGTTLILILVSALFFSGIRIDGFPNEWDFRGLIALAIIIFLVGIWDYILAMFRSTKK